MGDLAAEVCERLEQDLEENERKATLLTISFQYIQNKVAESHTRSIACTSYKQEKVTEQAFNIVSKATQQLPIAFLGISAGKFVKAKGSENFKNFFKTKVNNPSSLTKNIIEESHQESALDKSFIIDEIDPEEESRINENDKKINETGTILDENSKKNEVIEPTFKKKVNQKSSPRSKIQKSLKTDNFKKSFFMNILKEKQPNKDHDSSSVQKPVVSPKSDCSEQDSGSNIDDDILESNTETVLARLHGTKSQESSSTSRSSNALEKLKEIFPDLNDIDPTVVKLLPIPLQDEAKKLLKMKNSVESSEKNEYTNNSKDKEIIKSNRGRPPKIKSQSNNQKSKIKNFFIKTDVNTSSNDFKKCPECGQLILVSKFEEHKDYHVARNLQREINQPTVSDDTRKRKALEQSPSRPKKRVSDEIVYNIPKPEKVASFFE